MSRRRWRITLLAALATLSAVYPVTSLINQTDWVQPVVLVVALVAGLGLVLRGLTRSRVVVPLVQVVVVGWAILFSYAGSSFRFLLLPTTETLVVANDLGLQALEAVQRYTSPIPSNDGVTFCLVVAVALAAILVDAMAATWRSPAAAGLPLLTAYLITAVNSQGTLALRYFVVPALLWVAMIHTTARAQFGRWGTTASTEAPGTDAAPLEATGHDRAALRSFSAGAVRLGLLALVAAIVVPVVVPHFPTRYLTDGLGRTAGSGESGTVGFNDTIDLSRSLNNTDESPVLRYTTTGFGRNPLRVLATSYYSRGQWLVVGGPGPQPDQPQPLPPPDQRTDYVLSVTDNTLAAPRIAAPYPVVAVSMPGTPWTIDPVTRDVRVRQAVGSYRVTFADLAPTPPQLRESGRPDSPDITDDDLAIPDTAADLVRSWSDRVTASADNPLDKAIAIQDHLRNTAEYTYTLDLGEPVRDEAGRIVEPIRTFYETKRGYCVQFATAMIMLARAQGIPARMAIGFLPGTRDGESWLVKASDAHAWPELYFQGYGWLRFEPTPGARSGNPPPYTVVGSDAGATGGGRAVGESSATAAPSSSAATQPGQQAAGVSGVSTTSSFADVFTLRTLTVALALLVGLLATFLMPLTAWLGRARRRRAAVTRRDLIEVEWAELTSHLRDLGLPPPEGGTLRQMREQFIREGHLDEANASAVRRVTTTLEKSRYDRPERTTPEEAEALQRDIRAIRHQVSSTRAWSTRVRSFFWPTTGVTFWRSLPQQVGRALRSRRR